jgi:hypothetical protein
MKRHLRSETQEDFFNPNILHEIRIVIKPIDWQTLKSKARSLGVEA